MNWIDVCQSNGNLLAAGGENNNIKIFDKRLSKIVQTFYGIHKGYNFLFNKLFSDFLLLLSRYNRMCEMESKR